MIDRSKHQGAIRELLSDFPVVAITGARQVGKTTLAARIAETWEEPSERFDLEDPADLARLSDPMLALRPMRGLVILDEIQRLPDLFPILRVLSDRPNHPATFLILGSASPDLPRQSSETLAGRIATYELPGFALSEVGAEETHRLWLRGCFPLSFLAPTEKKSLEWRTQFIGTYLERDIPALGITIPSHTLRRFWAMLAHCHGQRWNASEFARSFGVADTTIRRYLDILTGAYLVRQIQPWHENLSKRQVKAPKIFLTDSGLLHSLLGIESRKALLSHPKLGASWEGFAMEAIRRAWGLSDRDVYHWATHTGAELDMLVIRDDLRIGVEIKHAEAPKTTRSMHIALQDLKLDHLYVIHAGNRGYALARNISALPLSDLPAAGQVFGSPPP